MLLLVAIQLAIFAFEIGYIWYFRRVNSSVIVNDKFSKHSVDRLSRGGYINIMLDYLQVISILKNYPLMVSGFIIGLTHFGNPIGTLFYSSDCIFIQLGFPAQDLFYSKLVAISILPFMKIALCLIFGFAKKFIYSDYHFGTYTIVAIQCIVLIEQPSMISTFASTFLCKSTDPSATDQSNIPYYLNDSPYVTCYTQTYNQYRNVLVIPMLALWGVCYPLLLLAVLVSKRAKLQTHEFAMKLGNQYAAYRSKYFFWNLVQFMQKLILIFFAQVSFLSLKMAGLTLYLILIAYLIIINKLRPYRSVDLQKTYIHSLYVFLFTIFLAVYGYEEANLNGLISSLIIIINTAFIAFIVIKLLHLMGFRCMTRLLNGFLNYVAGNSEKKNYFFDESYNTRAESVNNQDFSKDSLTKSEINDEAEKTKISDAQPEKSHYIQLNT